MSGVMRAALLAILAAVLSLLLREAGFRGSRLVALVGTVLLLTTAVHGIRSVIDTLLSHSLLSDGLSELSGAAMKTVGAGMLFGGCADVCRELGESGLANGVLVVGRVEIFLISLPYLIRLIDLAVGYLS